MVYFTHARLMRESESSVQYCAESGDGAPQRICADLIGNRPRYSTWFSFHDGRMSLVTAAKRREPQILTLRLVATQQVHRAALVRHLRDNAVTGREREFLLREFHGPLDSECAILAEHRVYTQAVSSQLCAADLLELSFDRFGAALVETYERQYGIFFAMHCDQLRAKASGRQYLLSSLLPEVRENAKRLRTRLLSGERLPARRVLLPVGGVSAAGAFPANGRSGAAACATTGKAPAVACPPTGRPPAATSTRPGIR